MLFPLCDQTKIAKNMSRAARRLITISPADGKYHGDWTCDYLVSLRDLQLQDLIEVEDDPRKNAQVFIKLYIQKVVSSKYFILTCESIFWI